MDNLLTKVTQELQQFGIRNRQAAEIVIDIAVKNPTFNQFKNGLFQQRFNFPDHFMHHILRLILVMCPPRPPPQPPSFYQPQRESVTIYGRQEDNGRDRKRGHQQEQSQSYDKRQRSDYQDEPNLQHNNRRRDGFDQPRRNQQFDDDRRRSNNYDGRSRSTSDLNQTITLEDGEHNEEGEEVDDFHYALNLNKDQVPEYILRMREMGPINGYPPALIDQHVRVCNALPFFGGNVDTVLPKRTIYREKLPAFCGFTNLEGTEVSEEFADLMQKLAEVDYEKSMDSALERSGLESFNTTNGTVVDERRRSEVIRYEIPEYEIASTSDYQFANETKSMKHNLDNFADGIQPFTNSHINKPTFFMQKLKTILNKSESSPAISKIASTSDIK